MDRMIESYYVRCIVSGDSGVWLKAQSVNFGANSF